MARLLSWPVGIIPKKATPLSGPQSIGEGANQSINGFIQTRSSPFGLWRWQFEFDRMKGVKARRYSGLITGLHAGANAVRVPYFTGNPVEISLWGVSYGAMGEEVPWSNGKFWSNDRGWTRSPPLVGVAAIAAKGSTKVNLGPHFWGWKLGVGDVFGFSPYHFGWYQITEVIGNGRYRIWPPLRADLRGDSMATLAPVMAMRMDGKSAATFSEEVGSTSESTMILVEVDDADVRKYFDG